MACLPIFAVTMKRQITRFISEHARRKNRDNAMLIIIIAVLVYWIIGVYIGCLWCKCQFPSLDIDFGSLLFSMTIAWIFWPPLLFGLLLQKHFNG